MRRKRSSSHNGAAKYLNPLGCHEASTGDYLTANMA